MKADITQVRLEVPEFLGAERLLSSGGHAIALTAAEAREANSPCLLSVAGGLPDHACTCLKHAGEPAVNRPLASAGPSAASQCGVGPDINEAMCISISQWSQGTDIVQLTKALRSSGALATGFTNDPAPGLADVVDRIVPVHAGPELSVAARKTFVTALVAGLWPIAEVKMRASLLSAMRALPDRVEAATRCDWSHAADVIDGRSLFAPARGPSWAITNEAALKFTETCQAHAESCSIAEVFHGPVPVVGQGFPVVAFAADYAAKDSLAETADARVDKGGQAFAVADKARKAARLQHVRTGHWLVGPVADIVSFCGMVEAVAVRRGIDPDSPRHLNRVTETT